MNSIEKVAFDRYLSDQSLPERKRMNASNYIDWANLGAREAQRWISIKESMPEDHAELLLDKKGKGLEITKPVLIKYENGRYAIDCRRNAGDSYNFWKIDHSGIIEWRPIERK